MLLGFFYGAKLMYMTSRRKGIFVFGKHSKDFGY